LNNQKIQRERKGERRERGRKKRGVDIERRQGVTQVVTRYHS